MLIILNEKHFMIFLGKCKHKSIKATKNQIVRLQLNGKKSKERQATLMA